MKMKFKIKNKFDFRLKNNSSKKHRLKSSQKRLFIIEYFLNQDKHYSVEELYNHIKNRMPGIGYSTVYRALKLLVSQGLAVERNFEKGLARFEPVHKERHHDHLVCIKCGTIIEFTNPAIEKIQKKIAINYKFTVTDHKLEIYGLCQKCKKKEKNQ